MSKRKCAKQYPREFREQIVELVGVGNCRLGAIAEEFGVSRESVRRWVKQAALDAGKPAHGLTPRERDELARLRRELREMREKRAILAKAVAWFARESGSIAPRRTSSFERTRRSM